MAKELTMPTTPNFLSSEFELVRSIGQTVSPFTGQQKTQEFDNVFWRANVVLPPMNRSTAVNWQSFLSRLKGSANVFKFTDPDALTNTGTYDADDLKANARISNTNVALTFSGSTITAGASTFANAIVGDYIVVTGADNEANNGTHKITTVTSNTVVVVDSTLTGETGTSGCKVQQNIKGAQGLSLLATSNTAAGTIAVGDYLGVLGGTSTTSQPVQLLLVTEAATETAVGGGANKFSVGVEPKLRSALADNNLVKFASPKGLFRLLDNDISWSADRNSIYRISFSCVESL
tara:strand:- start:1950 stop:2822 length:873 start_codon:yes stop_codon:yes gene_type:complete